MNGPATIDARFRVDRGAFVLDVDLRIPGRGVTALFGRSGSGKTTLLRCLAGLERIHGGRLRFMGEAWQDERSFLPVHRRPLGYVFQEASLFPHLRVRGNLAYGMKRVPETGRRVDFDETVDLLGLAGLLDRYPGELSGGQRQRAAMGRALLTGPRLLLMDEPMASLDAASKAEILPYIERLHGRLSIPVVYVSHAIDEVARIADHMVLLEDGRVLAEGPLAEMLTRGDLPLAHTETASAVIEAVVARHDDRHHLTELAFDGGTLVISREEIEPGQWVRVRVMARDVAINLAPPEGTSVLNCFPSRVLEISDDPHPGHVVIRLGVADQILLARITRRSLERLGLAPGMDVHALIKGVALT